MLDNTTIFLVDSQGIEDLLHEYGINIRYIGSLAEKVNLDFNKKILETEMIARACKRYFFKTFLTENIHVNGEIVKIIMSPEERIWLRQNIFILIFFFGMI